MDTLPFGCGGGRGISSTSSESVGLEPSMVVLSTLGVGLGMSLTSQVVFGTLILVGSLVCTSWGGGGVWGGVWSGGLEWAVSELLGILVELTVLVELMTVSIHRKSYKKTNTIEARCHTAGGGGYHFRKIFASVKLCMDKNSTVTASTSLHYLLREK